MDNEDDGVKRILWAMIGSGPGFNLKFMRKSKVKKNELQTNNSESVSQHGSPLRMKPSQHCGLLGSAQRSPRSTYQQATPQRNLHRVQRTLRWYFNSMTNPQRFRPPTTVAPPDVIAVVRTPNYFKNKKSQSMIDFIQIVESFRAVFTENCPNHFSFSCILALP